MLEVVSEPHSSFEDIFVRIVAFKSIHSLVAGLRIGNLILIVQIPDPPKNGLEDVDSFDVLLIDGLGHDVELVDGLKLFFAG